MKKTSSKGSSKGKSSKSHGHGPAAAKKVAPAAGKKPSAMDHVLAAQAAEGRGDWGAARDAWTLAAAATSSTKDRGAYKGKAAGASVRAAAKVPTPAQQADLARAHPDIVRPVPVPAKTAPAASAASSPAAPATGKKERKAREPKPAKVFAHDERVKPWIGKTITRTYTRKGESVERTATIKVTEVGFEWEGKTFTSPNKLAREVTGTGWTGLVWLKIVPYNGRERRGVSADELATSYAAAADAYNHAQGHGGIAAGKLPSQLAAVVELPDVGQARAHAQAMHAAAEALRKMAAALAAGANLVEVRRGKAAA